MNPKTVFLVSSYTTSFLSFAPWDYFSFVVAILLRATTSPPLYESSLLFAAVRQKIVFARNKIHRTMDTIKHAKETVSSAPFWSVKALILLAITAFWLNSKAVNLFYKFCNCDVNCNRLYLVLDLLFTEMIFCSLPM